MGEKEPIRYGWLKVMYVWTILIAGGFGLGLLTMPEQLRAMFGWPSQDPVLFGIVGCVYVAFGLLAILGLRSPLKFVPLLLLQLCYKLIWYLVIFVPTLMAGRVQMYGWVFAGVFATYIVGNLIAIPFSYVFEKEAR
ncbi:MAG: hypothetical protein LUO82_06310 [Methanomicrobiales archaeon]|nr:hypothetical protein [Methanomicrobiales archaeon]